jgi:hypothetical protein
MSQRGEEGDCMQSRQCRNFLNNGDRVQEGTARSPVPLCFWNILHSKKSKLKGLSHENTKFNFLYSTMIL